MKNIHITMQTAEGEYVEREIDITNFTLYDGRIPSVERQHDLLLEWIEERGNPQHDTTLSLVKWYIA